jgi:adenylate cyclase
MAGIRGSELAARAGVTEEHVLALAAAGVLTPSTDGGETTFEPADINRIRLAEALIESGITVDDLHAAISDGRLSFDFIGMLFPEPVDYVPGTTMGEFAEANGVPMELVRQVHARLGLAAPEPGDPIRSDEAEYMPIAALALGAGFGEAGLAHFSRVMGENLRRLAEAQVHFFTTEVIAQMIASGMRPLEAWQTSTQVGAQMRPLFEKLLVWVYERHQETYILENVVELMEEVLRGESTRRSRANDQAIAFLDLSGFTRLTEERGDEAAAELATTLADLVLDASQPHGGKPVKYLGDGVMFHFPRAGAAVLCALELVERTPEEGLPPAHVGVSTGPLILRDGDYFGRTVNIAARVAAKAGPHQVFVTDEVVRSATDGPVEYRPVGEFELKGVAAPMMLHLAERSR